MKIVAIADRSKRVLEETSQLPGMADATAYDDYHELLQHDLDAVSIVAPIPFHEEMTQAAIARGLYVLLEKPPVPEIFQLEELISQDSKKKVMVAFQHPYYAHLRALKADLLSGRWGAIRRISTWGAWPRETAYYRRAGWAGRWHWNGRLVMDGPATNAMSHYLNFLFFITGECMESSATPLSLESEVYRARPELESYDAAFVRGMLHTGVPFFYGVTHASREVQRVETTIHTDRHILRLSDDLLSLSIDHEEAVSFPDGRQLMFNAFLQFANGDGGANATPLAASRSYVGATSEMFRASGGIHQISSDYVDVPAEGAQDGVFHIQEVNRYLRECSFRHALPRELGAPWAVKHE